MAVRLAIIAMGLLHIAAALPALTLQDMEMADDTMSVGTFIREVRAAPKEEEDYHRSYENEGDGEIGYSRKKSGGGKKGYQHFNAYHKKAGDNYEFEKQDSYGQEDEKQAGAHSHNHETRALKYREPEREDLDENERQPAEKQEKEKDHEEIKEGDSDGNGGVEAQGHDPADYILPEKYTYGSGETYNF